jgi:hypothetical protein
MYYKQIGVHQYSATHFERDLDKGPDETTAGVHISHLSAGLPGTPSILYPTLQSKSLTVPARRLLQLRDLANPCSSQ